MLSDIKVTLVTSSVTGMSSEVTPKTRRWPRRPIQKDVHV